MHYQAIVKAAFLITATVILAGCNDESGGGQSSQSSSGIDAQSANDSGAVQVMPAGASDPPEDLSRLPVTVPDRPVEVPSVEGVATRDGVEPSGTIRDSTVAFVGQAPVNGSVELELDGTLIGSALARSDGTWVFDYQSVTLSSGEYELDVTSVASGGQRTPAESTFRFAYVPDTLAVPVVQGVLPDTGSSNSDGITSAPAIQLEGTATPGLPVTVFLDGSAAGSARADEGGNWLFDYRSESLADGVYSFTAQTDLDGVTSAVSAAFVVRVDTAVAAPTLALVNDTSGGSDVTSDPTVIVGGTAEPLAVVEVLRDGSSVGTTTVAGDGSWSFEDDDPGLTDGAYDYTAVVTDTAGNTSTVSVPVTVELDSTDPVLDSLAPANGATDAALGSDLTLTFVEPVFPQTGNLTVFRASDDSVFEQIPIGDPQVSGASTDTLTVNLSTNLMGSQGYYVLLDAGSLEDQAGNSYAGITDPLDWQFTAEATGIEALTPADNAPGVAPDTSLTMQFNEPVQVNSGNLVVRQASDDAAFFTIDMTGAAVAGEGTDTLVVTLPDVLDAGSDYYVEMNAGVVENPGGFPFAGFSGATDWNFSTDPGSVATVTSVTSPVTNGTYDTSSVIPVQVVFSEAVFVTGGTPTLTLDLDDSDPAVSYVSGSGSDTLVFEYTVALGDSSSDLAYLATNALALNGSRIRSASFADSDLTLPGPGGGGSLAGNKDIVIAGEGINAGDPGDQGYTVTGPQTGSEFAAALAGVGDVNGDGFEDYAVGAPGLGNGTVYVLWGKNTASPPDIVLAPDGSIDPADGFRILGAAAGDRLGAGVGGAGDFNGDGIDDLYVTAPGSDIGAADRGAVYVIWGQGGATRATVDMSPLASGAGATNAEALVIRGSEDGQQLGGGSGLAPFNGQVVAAGGDFNGDGIHDLVIGHPGSDANGVDAGQAYVILGRRNATRANLSLASLGSEGFRLFPGGNAGWAMGQGVRFIGDFNNNGYHDLALGAPGSDAFAGNAGQAYVVFGGTGTADVDLTALAGSDGFAVYSGVAGALVGHSLAGGDFNGDGRGDLLVSGHGNHRAHVIYGYDAGSYGDIDLDIMAPGTGYTILSESGTDALGHALDSAGDFNGDGVDDLLLGAYLNDAGGAEAGAAWLILGQPGTATTDLDLSTLTSSQGIRLFSDTAGDRLGIALGHGDFNGDGLWDLVLGAPLRDAGDADSGQATVILGQEYAATLLVGSIGSGADDLIVGSAGDDLITGGGGFDAISTGAGSDIIDVPDLNFAKVQGGRGNPTTGMDALRLSGLGLTLDLTAVQPQWLNDIEMIDLNGGGNTLNLNPLSLLALSRETHQLYVAGDGSDAVSVAAGDIWFGDGTENVGTDTYNKYVSGGAELFLDGLVNQGGIATFGASQRYNLDTTGSGAAVGSNVTDFPVLVRINDAGIIDATEADARDIRVLGPDNTLLDYEIERWDQGANVAELWVRMPVVYGSTDGAASTDRNFFTVVYDGGAGVPDGQDPDGLWAKYSGVWHMDEPGSNDNALDSSAFGNDASLVNGQGNSQNAIVGLGRQFTANESMSVPYDAASISVAGNQPFSYSAWIRQVPSSYACFGTPSRPMIQRGTGGNRFRMMSFSQTLFICNLTAERLILSDGTVLGGGNAGWAGDDPGWVFFTAVYDGSGTTFYKDGNVFDSDTGVVNMENNQPIGFGANDMIYDELRYGRFAKSNAEVSLMFENQRPSGQSLVSPAP